MSKLILVVEDQSSLAFVLKEYLESEGFNVISARTAEDALELLKEHKPDLAILDLMLPKMSGQEFLQHIHSQNPALTFPVIVLSNFDHHSEMVHELPENGNFDFLVKADSSLEVIVDHVKTKLASSGA